MSSEPRKATDVLLDLESKVDILLNIVKSQDLNIKIISNKLNDLIKVIQTNNQIIPKSLDNNIVDNVFVDESKKLTILAENAIPIDTSPNGFRRTSRPETYVGEAAKNQSKEAEIIIPKEAAQQSKIQKPQTRVHERVQIQTQEQNQQLSPPQLQQQTQNSIPIVQRVVDKNGKSVFLADIEIINSNGEKIHKTRTNGAGKWMASLIPGNYKVVLNKREQLTKEKIEAIQDIKVDGSVVPLELKMLILK